jgi:general secretion pathway protein J
MRAHRGFTLLELLVAIFVAAVMFAIGYAGLTQVARNRADVLVAQRDLGELQRAVRILASDLGQVDPRPVRDELGRAVSPALMAEPGTPSPLGFTRAGRVAGATPGRSSLQRIEYLIENGALVRLSWQVLDRAQGSRASRRVLLRGVRGLSFRFLDGAGQWSTDWPTAAQGTGSPAALRLRPRAIELVLDTEAYGPIRRVIEIPG